MALSGQELFQTLKCMYKTHKAMQPALDTFAIMIIAVYVPRMLRYFVVSRVPLPRG